MSKDIVQVGPLFWGCITLTARHISLDQDGRPFRSESQNPALAGAPGPSWRRNQSGWKEAIIKLPHDGVATNNVSGKRYMDHWVEAGFEVDSPIKNSGAGAAMMRIEAGRRVFPRCWFNEETTEPGRDALGYYHERRDPERHVGMGPDHDWSSHAADAFGYMAIDYEEPAVKKSEGINRRRDDGARRSSHWAD
jgi:hypothetical protein